VIETDTPEEIQSDLPKALFIWCSQVKQTRLLPIFLMLAACTSLEDFQNMGPDERAQRVCAGSSGYAERSRSLRELDEQIGASQALLAKGYRVYEQCQIVTVPVDGVTIDCGDATGKELKKCQKANRKATTDERRVCTQTAVPIDYAYESHLLGNLRMQRLDLKEQHEQLTLSCQDRVRFMPSDEAYEIYSGDTD
jgi:hypothetical protein